MDYQQYRRARKLVHECCNYDNGNGIALDDGEEYTGSPQSRMTLWGEEEQRNEQVLPQAIKRATRRFFKDPTG